MGLTLDKFLGTVLSIAIRENSTVSTNDMFDEAEKLYGDKKPSSVWIWKRDNKIARKTYKLPEVIPLDLSSLDSEINQEELENIIAQLKTSLDLNGYKVKFNNNTQIVVDDELAEIILDKMMKLKPIDRLQAQEFCLESYENLKTFSEGNL